MSFRTECRDVTRLEAQHLVHLLQLIQLARKVRIDFLQSIRFEFVIRLVLTLAHPLLQTVFGEEVRALISLLGLLMLDVWLDDVSAAALSHRVVTHVACRFFGE